MYSVSVAMAAYNGERFITEQINSIVKQLQSSDELIISYNPSTDDTERLIKDIVKADCRVKAYLCQEKGVIKNFENAIRKCSNDIIFLSDQDDVWIEGKVEKVLEEFKDALVLAVVHGGYLTDRHLNVIKDIGLIKKRGTVKPFRILWKNQIQGSCMAFRKDYMDYVLPFPENIPMHDSWIGMVLSRFGKVVLIPDKLLLYRQHDSNVTSRKHGRVIKMFSDRLSLLINYYNRITCLHKHCV